MWNRFVDWVLGRRLRSEEQEEQHIGPLSGIPVLGLDALASAAYGPEAALTLLIPLGAGALHAIAPIMGVILCVLAVLYFSYRQTIAEYPGGGGSYTVATQNLGRLPGLVAGVALAIDYVLNVAVGIAAGVGALVSAVPVLLPFTLALCLGILALLTLVNLRGIRESGLVFMGPTYAFVATLGVVLLVGLVKTVAAAGHPQAVAGPPPIARATEAATWWILFRAFANGCTAMTGVEAVSNGVPVFRQPTTTNADRTLTAIMAILAALLGGVVLLVRAYGITATDPGRAGYQSILSMVTAAVVGRGPFYYVTMASVVAVLALSANTSFADFPRLCRVLAEDRFLPDSFAFRGRRLVFTQGIVLLAALSGTLILVFGGITDRLIPLFAVGALLAFTMSQAGMVAHWRRVGGRRARRALPINALGATATGITVLIVTVSKFAEGAWITAVVLPLLVGMFLLVNRHYRSVAAQIATDAAIAVPASAPIVVLAAQSWNRLTKQGLEFAIRASPEVYVVHVRSENARDGGLEAHWADRAAAPAVAASLAPPKLVVLTSHYRQLFRPFLDFVLTLRDSNPGRDIVVVIPDLVLSRWYQPLFHNRRGLMLRSLLRARGGPHVVIVNAPFYLR